MADERRVRLGIGSTLISETFTYDPIYLRDDRRPSASNTVTLFGHHSVHYLTRAGRDVDRTQRFVVTYTNDDAMVARIDELGMTECLDPDCPESAVNQVEALAALEATD